jgi:hypothetical protein
VTPLRELRYEWTYEDLLKAAAILDMENAVSMARDWVDAQEMKKTTRH